MDASQIAALSDSALSAKVAQFTEIMDPANRVNMFLFVMLTSECAARAVAPCRSGEASDECEGRRSDWADLVCELAAWTVS